MDSFPEYRSVRGDGNCFYRAFAFLLLKNTKAKSYKELFPEIELKCEKLPFEVPRESFDENMKNEISSSI